MGGMIVVLFKPSWYSSQLEYPSGDGKGLGSIGETQAFRKTKPTSITTSKRFIRDSHNFMNKDSVVLVLYIPYYFNPIYSNLSRLAILCLAHNN